MTRRLLKTLALLPLLGGMPLAHALDAEALFQQLSPSIWVVQAMDAQGKLMSTGSAVVIGPQRLVTNCHVLARAHSFKLRRGTLALPGKLEFPDVERDLCQVRADGMVAPVVKVAPSTGLRVGQRVFTLGAPVALEETISDGLLSSLRRDEAGKLRYLQTSAPTSVGSSGGGLFNDRGELIGITTAMLAGNTVQNLSFAVPADWIWELETRGREALAKRAAGARLAAAPAPAPTPAPTPTPAAPATAPAPLPVATATVASADKWSGYMRCEARAGQGADHAAYQARFEVEMAQGKVSLRRKEGQVAEALVGQVADNRLDIKGVGYREDQPGQVWRFRFAGDFPAGTAMYLGRGSMLLGQEPVRQCDLVLTRA